ncbi:hypothetical protein [Yersinia phage fHe-Yen9-03]|uniref:Uncharacterized protein n=1 Tax=Yersinia phage fHe-Yen9-03 TaxID=2052743 RepID=A0A2C9D1R5_9CAUD|nr:hypothetical protein [Yersinia phage fHe-Yen9-03]
MQVQFQTVLFNSEDFRFAVVLDETLVLVTAKGEIELEFDSSDEALEGQRELGRLLDAAGAKDKNATSIVKDVVNTVSELFSNLGTVKSKVYGKVQETSETVNSNLEDILRKLDSAIKAEETKQPTTQARNTSTADAEDVFGRNRQSSSRNVADANSVISTLSDAELETVINSKVEHLLLTNTQVQGLVAQLRRFHNEDEVQEVISSHKEMVFNVSRANDNLTVNEVITQLLR